MGWVRLDDNYSDHPKVIGLSDSAFRTYITALCYANRQLTDGYIPQAVYDRWGVKGDSVELVGAGLWELALEGGWNIRSYEEYQPLKEKVEEKRNQGRERLRKFREGKRNANETQTPTQPNPTQPNPSKDIKDNYYLAVVDDEDSQLTPAPRVRTAKEAVLRISDKLDEARKSGVNAWNLSKLVETEWDMLHNNNDIGGCIALTAWYVSELQSRQLTSTEIARIGQMTKRFGRIALLSIDEAASKDLDDLVSYAFRIAQRMYTDRKANQK